MTLAVNCPTCQAPVTWNDSSPERPFCSKRCRMIDLGAWAAEEHVISTDDGSDEQDIFSEDLSTR